MFCSVSFQSFYCICIWTPTYGNKMYKLDPYCIQDWVFLCCSFKINIVSIFLRINSLSRVGDKSLISKLRDEQEKETQSVWPRRTAFAESLHWFAGLLSSSRFHQDLFAIAAGSFSDENNTLPFLWGPSTPCAPLWQKTYHNTLELFV